MDILRLQQRLTDLGFDPGPVDGVAGGKTYAALLNYTADRKIGPEALSLGTAAARYFPPHMITSALRVMHFIAQATHETGNFHFFVELGGPKYTEKYDGRADLGNTQPGDGHRYRGRGIFQLTGRANYTKIGRELALDLVNHPELAADPGNAVLIACRYWTRRNINAAADTDDVTAVTRKINGGVNGLKDRRRYVERLRAVLL